MCVSGVSACAYVSMEGGGVLGYQIWRTQAEPQRIVAQGPLSRVQSLVLYLSRIQRICLSLSLNLVPPRLLVLWWPSESRCNGMILDCTRQSIRTHENRKGELVSPLSSMDSGLEAFSRNPTHGSFSALTFQSTEVTNYVNQRFLSYWIGLLSRRPFHQ